MATRKYELSCHGTYRYRLPRNVSVYSYFSNTRVPVGIRRYVVGASKTGPGARFHQILIGSVSVYYNLWESPQLDSGFVLHMDYLAATSELVSNIALIKLINEKY